MWAQLVCPGNTTPFDYQECDPEIRSECPAGFTCRFHIVYHNYSVHISIIKFQKNYCKFYWHKFEYLLWKWKNDSGWLWVSKNAKRKVQYPCYIFRVCRETVDPWYCTTNTVHFDPNCKRPRKMKLKLCVIILEINLAPASSLLNFPPIHVGDEVVVLSFPSYITGLVQSFTLPAQVNPGYIHLVTIIGGWWCVFSHNLLPLDPLYKPFAVLMNYNIIVGQPTQTVNVTSSRFVAYLDNSASMPQLDSCKYDIQMEYCTSFQTARNILSLCTIQPHKFS